VVCDLSPHLIREDLSLCQTDGVNGMTWVAQCGGSHTTGDLSLGWGDPIRTCPFIGGGMIP